MFQRSLSFALLLLTLSAVVAEEQPKFRTDADGPYKPDELTKLRSKDIAVRNEVVQWYQLEEGHFPPAGSAHTIAGELILVDHIERRFQLRADRTDLQERGSWDLPLNAEMLPYGSIEQHGAHAALQDIPLGTHLHGEFYVKDPEDKAELPIGPPFSRYTPENDFRRCFRLEDDFSHDQRLQQTWQVESVDLSANKLTALLQREGKPVGEPKTFDISPATRVYQGKGFTELQAIQAGQNVLFNLTWGTLYGPGRITDLWLDEESRAATTARQREKHLQYIRERGLPGWVTAVDDQEQIVTVVFFGNVDDALLTEWQKSEVGSGGLAVAHPNLNTYDPVNDRKGGRILDVQTIPAEPGSSGVQIRLKMDLLLEGYRPKHIVRFYPSPWKVIALPREEQYFGKE